MSHKGHCGVPLSKQTLFISTPRIIHRFKSIMSEFGQCPLSLTTVQAPHDLWLTKKHQCPILAIFSCKQLQEKTPRPTGHRVGVRGQR